MLHVVVSVVLAFLMITPGICSCKDDDAAVQKCVIEYATGFADPKYSSWDDLQLHCHLDGELGKCVQRYLKKDSGPTLVSLAKAAVSYILFEKKIKVCDRFPYKPLLKKLDKVCQTSQAKKDWKKKIERLNKIKMKPYYGHSHLFKCTSELDRRCVREYAKRMRTDQNLCKNIPYKYQCLRNGYHGNCRSNAIRYILDIFPAEADKVLAKLCQSRQDVGV
ncbi:uncharacterized protein LOC110241714 [Exaiptasia diaphana]|uniref:Uncharacterized protein n=1 Tax=Exaiptasia diaphana TaxID=2652724 RepID=A0A913XF87_EXADI|nr:uncharacterized protein LOC110241714 [Exaiptasia diaphana]KXJ12714.1 hypothetical protein AC249_AIPGENE22095 [Exaiptasia diaphana]